MRSKTFWLFIFTFSFVLNACSGGSGDDDGGGSPDPLLTNACSVIGLNTRIINGTACSDNNSPVVQIRILPDNDPREFNCSGTLITATDVLTAAHCFLQSGSGRTFVVINNQSIPGTATLHPSAAIVSDGDDVEVVFDVAIVKLSRAVSLPTLPVLISDPVVTDEVISIYGYGLDENGVLGTLRSGQSRVDSVDEQHIAAEFTGDGSNSCNGDSGGPAVMAIVRDGISVPGIVGLVSSGSVESCGIGDRSLYTNVTSQSMLNFIQSTAPGVNLL